MNIKVDGKSVKVAKAYCSYVGGSRVAYEYALRGGARVFIGKDGGWWYSYGTLPAYRVTVEA